MISDECTNIMITRPQLLTRTGVMRCWREGCVCSCLSQFLVVTVYARGLRAAALIVMSAQLLQTFATADARTHQPTDSDVHLGSCEPGKYHDDRTWALSSQSLR